MELEAVVDKHFSKHREIFFIRVLVVGYPLEVLLLEGNLSLSITSLAKLVGRLLLDFVQEI